MSKEAERDLYQSTKELVDEILKLRQERDGLAAQVERMQQTLRWIARRFCHGIKCVIADKNGPAERCEHQAARELLDALPTPAASLAAHDAAIIEKWANEINQRGRTEHIGKIVAEMFAEIDTLRAKAREANP